MGMWCWVLHLDTLVVKNYFFWILFFVIIRLVLFLFVRTSATRWQAHLSWAVKHEPSFRGCASVWLQLPRVNRCWHGGLRTDGITKVTAPSASASFHCALAGYSAVYCNRSCMWVCMCVCVFVGVCVCGSVTTITGNQGQSDNLELAVRRPAKSLSQQCHLPTLPEHVSVPALFSALSASEGGYRNAWTRGGTERPWRQMEGAVGAVDYWQTGTCSPSDVIAYTSVKMLAWWTSFGGPGQTFEWGPRPAATLPLEATLERINPAAVKRRLTSSTTFCIHGWSSGASYGVNHRRPCFRRRRSTSMEQSSSRSAPIPDI